MCVCVIVCLLLICSIMCPAIATRTAGAHWSSAAAAVHHIYAFCSSKFLSTQLLLLFYAHMFYVTVKLCAVCTRRWRESIRQTPCPDNLVGWNHLIAVFIALAVACSCAYAQAAHCISQHSHVHYVDCGFFFFFFLLIYVQLASVTALPPRCVCFFFTHNFGGQ